MDFGTVLHVIVTGVVLLVMMSILVAAHELGHYLFARLFRMGVEEFAIGFGKKPLWTYMRKTYEVDPIPDGGNSSTEQFTEKERYDYLTDGANALQPEPIADPTPSKVKLSLQETTDFTIRPWPLGGFVRIKGMIPQDDGSETKIPGGFYSKAPWKRFIVLLAGPVFSVVTGVLILFAQTVVLGKQVPSGTVLDEIIKDGPAYVAGLRPGDQITNIDGQPIKSAYEVGSAIRDKDGKQLKVSYIRNGIESQTTLIPKLEPEASPVLGLDGKPTGVVKKQAKMFAKWDQRRVPVPVGEAFTDAAKVPGEMIAQLARLVTKPKELKENVGGPISIARATSDAVKLGPGFVIFLSALLSISVGIFNLLPIPPLDGGQMMVAVAETLRRGKRLSIQVQGTIAACGFALVALFFVTVMFIDVERLVKPKPKPEIQKQTTPAPAK